MNYYHYFKKVYTNRILYICIKKIFLNDDLQVLSCIKNYFYVMIV